MDTGTFVLGIFFLETRNNGTSCLGLKALLLLLFVVRLHTTRTPSLLLKLDVRKAFDSVRLGVLELL